MRIRKRRIRNLHNYLGYVPRRTRVVLGVKGVSRFADILQEAGFTADLEIGESLLPAPAFGPVSRFNAEGGYQVHRDQPMETAYRVAEWQWKEWHGPYRVERSKFVDVPYKRYPRTFIAPPSIQMRIGVTTEGEKLVFTPPIEFVDESEQLLVHSINLYLEMFRECTVLTENLEEIIRSPVVQLNWRVLPPGRWPWAELRKEVDPLIEQAPGGNQAVITRLLQ
jgi:hypothetical protein